MLIKKIAFIGLVAAALVCGIWGYFYLQELKTPTLRPIDVLPDNCVFLAEIKEPKKLVQQLTQGNLMWEELQKITGIKKLNAALLFLDSLTNDEEIVEVIGNGSLFVALYGDSAKQNTVFAFNLQDVNETEKVKIFFEKKFAAKKDPKGIPTVNYFCEMNFENKKTPFYAFIESGLVVLSENENYIRALSAKNKNSLAENKNFLEAAKTSSKDKRLNLFIHFPQFYKYSWPHLFSGKAGDYFSGEKERWISADAGIEPSDLNARGFLPRDSSLQYTSFKDQDADNFKELFSRLPYNTSWFEGLAISNYGAFVKDNYKGNLEKRKTDLQRYSDSLSSDAQTEITSFVGKYASYFEAYMQDSLYRFGLIKVDDADRAKLFLKNTADSVFVNNDSANLFYYADRSLFKNVCAGFFVQSFAFVSIVNESAIFCNSLKGLAEYKRSVNEINNFHANERTMAFLQENFNTDLNYLFYANVFKTKDKLRSYMSPALDERINEAVDLYEKFDAVAFSLQKVKTGIFFMAQAGFNPQYKMYQNTLWETVVDTDLIKLPLRVTNHITNESELVCQDLKNNFYLLSNTGRILWKKNIQEKILGEVHQVDYFKNNKLQLLFVTENYIHLIDRNGNYLKDFPVKIKAGASGGISLFDYDRSKNYRMWIPLKNNTVTCLSISCKPVEGFVPVSIRAPLSHAVKQVVLQQKDYFILNDTLGNVYVTNRKGEERVKINTKIALGDNPFYFDIGKDISKTYLCYPDLKAKVLCRLSLDDKLEKIALRTEKEPIGFFFDTLQTGISTLLVLIDEDALEAFDLFGKKVSEIKSQNDMQAKGASLNFGNTVKYVTLESSSGNLMFADTQTKTFSKNEIKLSDLPGIYTLINGQPGYLVGYYQNKIFCIRP